MLTGKSQAQPFPEIVPTNISIPSGTTQNTFGYIGQSTTISGTGSSTSTLSGFTVGSTGNGSNTPLFIYSPANETSSGAVGSPTAYAVTVSGLTVTNGLSHGGNSSFGGGGAGLGGGVFVGAGATLTLNNVNVTGNTATGGSAGITGGRGGGGIGGNSTNNNGGGLFVNNANSGAGGFGGGGGRNGGGTGNSGGFGGGGGFGINGGNAGFGGGGGGRSSGGQGFGGVGGGIGSPFTNAYGGGGAGFGGGVFVQNLATVIVTGNSTISGNTANAGNGADGGQNGAAAGADIFMMAGSTVILAPGTGNTVTIGSAADDTGGTVSDIADDSANSVFNGSGLGAALIIGNGGTPGGTVILHGNNTYAGGTTVQDGATLVVGYGNVLGSGDVTVDSGASLQILGGTSLNNNLTISGTGAGGAGAIFSTDPNFNYINGTVTLAADASIHNENGASLLFVNGNVDLGAHTLTAGGASQTIFGGQISGTGGFTIDSNGIAAMSGSTANTYTGVTTVESGAFLGLTKAPGVTSIPGDFNISGGVDDYADGQVATTSVVTLLGISNWTFVTANTTETIAGLNGTSSTTQVAPIFGAGGNTLVLEGTGTYSYAGQINDGAGAPPATMAVVKQGSGSQEFDGTNNYSGGTTLTSGTLIAGNASAFGTGLLQVNGGTLSMANNNHIITVGSYAQTGGTLYLSVNGTGQAATADLLHVTNSMSSQASLGGNLTANLTGFTAPLFGPATTYSFNVVTTDAGYLGTFGTLSTIDLGSGLTASLDYTSPDDVLLLIVHPANFFSLAGLSANQRAVLGSINAGLASGNGTANFNALVLSLTTFANNPSVFGGALDQLSPQAFGQFTSVTAFNNASFETEAMDNYLAGLRTGPNGTFSAGNGNIDSSGLTVNDPNYDSNLAMVHSRLMAWNPAPFQDTISDVESPLLGGIDMKDMRAMTGPAYNNPWNFFVRGNVVLAQGFSDPDVSHFNENSESVVLGTDYRITPNLLVGLSAGYGHTDVTLDNNGSSATVDSYSPGFYASYANKGWYANLSGDYVHNAYTQSRVIGFLGQAANSAPEGNEGVANLDGGYEFHRGAFTYGPLAGLQYTHLTVDGYNESGSIAALNVNEQDADSLRSRLGGRISFAFSHFGVNFTSHLDASWQHEFMDQSRGIDSQFAGTGLGSFSVRTENPSRDSALTDVGLDAEINRTLTVFADYEVQAGQENYFGQSVQAGLKIGF